MLTRSMALRVLLADESSTIKKVFQLALQDFAVEVTAVAVGVDVIQVAEKINPDIIFADVLLQKKNGYDVCQELKSISHLAHIPVILVWSGFMELDQQKYKASKANGHLEKPFDTKKLRSLIEENVPKTKSQGLSDFLTFPKMPQFDEMPRPHQPLDLGTGAVAATSSAGSWSMESFAPLEPVAEIHSENNSEDLPSFPVDDPEDFIQVELPAEPPRPIAKKSAVQAQIEKSILEAEEDEAQWVNQSLSQYKLAPEKQAEDVPRVKYKVPQEKIDPNILMRTTQERPPTPKRNFEQDSSSDDDLLELDLGKEDTLSARSAPTPSEPTPQLSEHELEKIIRAQSQEVIEKVVWQIVPEIATRIIEREIERLLKERNERR